MPAAPNRAIVKGNVIELCLGSSAIYGMRPERDIGVLVIHLEEAEGIAGERNFFKGKEGQRLKFFTKELPMTDIFGKKIKGVATFTGDETGGIYWISEIEIINDGGR